MAVIDGPRRRYRYTGAGHVPGPVNLPDRCEPSGPVYPGDEFTDVRDWSRKRGFVLAVEFAVPVPMPAPVEDAPILSESDVADVPPTLDPEELRTLKFAKAKAYAFDTYGIKARGWDELIREYTVARG